MPYGITVSQTGYDALTADEANLVYTSTAESHKVSATGTVTESTNVEHGLGYAPHADAYFYDGTSVWKGGTTYSAVPGGVLPYLETRCDSTYVRVTFGGVGIEKAFYVIFFEGNS